MGVLMAWMAWMAWTSMAAGKLQNKF